MTTGAAGVKRKHRSDHSDEVRVRSRKEELDWSHKQSRILTANGRAPEYYVAERGFPFTPDELPHHRLLTGSDRSSSKSSSSSSIIGDIGNSSVTPTRLKICGAWRRPLFVGEWEHSTSEDEHVFNLQTPSVFIDLRIPVFHDNDNDNDSAQITGQNLSDLSDDHLRRFARKHVFAGVTLSKEEEDSIDDVKLPGKKRRTGTVCTRHHCIDWNFIGIPRNRPNKWYVETMPTSMRRPNVWKEWSYATDDCGQHYYWERWERLPNHYHHSENRNNNNKKKNHAGDVGTPDIEPVFAMRKAPVENASSFRDAVLVVVGDHFNFVMDRTDLPSARLPEELQRLRERHGIQATNLVDLVDECLRKDMRTTAESFLSMDAGHGTVSSGWVMDAAIRPWRVGTALFGGGEAPSVVVTDGTRTSTSTSTATATRCEGIAGGTKLTKSCHILWDGERWDILECNLDSVETLRNMFQA